MTKEDDLFHDAIDELYPKHRTCCPFCDEGYNQHNYHDFVRCLEIANKIAKVMRHGRNGYGVNK